MHRRGKHILGSAVILLVAALAAVSLSIAPTGAQSRLQHLRITDTNSDMQSLDPQFGGTLSGEPPLLDMIYEGLVRLRPGSTDLKDIEPALAERWAASADRLVWTFFLRRGVQFHKGFGEFTSADAKFSLERNQTATSPWRSSYLNVAQIDAPNRYTIRITLKQPDLFFFISVANYKGGFITSRAAVEKYGDQYKLNPVGTGPFQFESYRPREKVELSRNDKYWRGKPILERVTWFFIGDTSARELAVRRRAVDMAVAEQSSDWIKSVKRAGVVAIGLGPGVPQYIHLNMTIKPLDDVRVRRGLEYATNQEEYRQLRGPDITSPVSSPVPPGYFGATEDVPKYPFNLARAKSLLEEAGKAGGFSLKAVVSELAGIRTVMELLQEQWRKVNVNVELQVVDHASFHRLIRQDKSDVIFYSFARAPLADVVLSEFFHSDATVGRPTAITNFSHYDKVDRLIEQARTTRNPGEQVKLYASIQKQIMDDAVVIPLMNTLWMLVSYPYVELPELAGIAQPSSLNYFVPITERTRLK